MKHIRLLTASLLMVLCLISVAVIYAAERNETVHSWQRVTFFATQDVHLFSPDGTLLQTIAPNGGQAVGKLLPAGRYYAVCDENFIDFMLFDDRTVQILSDCGWAEGNVLHFTTEPVGKICVEMTSQTEMRELLLCGLEVKRCNFVSADDATSVFTALPYGEYQLYCDGIRVATLSLNAEKPNLSVILT